MSLIKTNKTECKTILDFSNGRVSKHSITQSLRRLKDLNIYKTSHENIIFVNHEIKIGVFKVALRLDIHSGCDNKSLRQYGCFGVDVYEHNGLKNSWEELNTFNDKRFKSQPWVLNAFAFNLRIKDLIEIISYCNRLNNLRVFS